MRRRIAPVIAVAVALFVPGCTGGDRVDPESSTVTTTASSPAGTTSPATTSGSSRPAVAPQVTEPVDLRPFHARPCATVTSPQQNRIGLRPLVDETTTDLSGFCEWEHRSGPGTEHYAYEIRLNMSGDLLAEAYRESNEPKWVVFETRDIRGLPAVIRSLSTLDDQCEVIVGTGNGQSVEISGVIGTADPTMRDRLVTAAEWVVDAVRK